MTLKSMTGFARADGASGSTRWHWEVRGVNGRGLDVRMRLPPGYETLEARVREALGKHLARGSVSITLSVTRHEGVSEIRLNEAALSQVVAAAERVRVAVGGNAANTDTLLGLKGVLEFVEGRESEEESERRAHAMMASFGTALLGIVAARAGEGERLQGIVESLLASIARLADEIAGSPARQPEAIRKRLSDQIAKLLEAGNSLEPARLHQEAMLLATRADVEEELARLQAHVAGARELLNATDPVGRRLDFLSQEFNREANTLCSKSNDIEITRMGLQLKALIDQMREQVQNIE